jgi:hypothetical protein
MTKLEQVVAHWKAIVFQLVIAGLFTDQFDCVSNCSWDFKPSGVCFSQCKLREICELIEQPVVIYIYLCGQIYASCLYYISNSPTAVEQKLKCKIGVRDNIAHSFYHIRTVGASSLLVLTHCGRVTQLCVFTLQRCRMGYANLRF